MSTKEKDCAVKMSEIAVLTSSPMLWPTITFQEEDSGEQEREAVRAYQSEQNTQRVWVGH